MDLGVPRDLSAFAVHHLGPVDVLGGTGPWRLRCADGHRWLKQLRPGRAWTQTLRAHEVVVPALAAAGVPCPSLVAAEPRLRAILTTEVPGRPVSQTDPARVWRAAGTAVAALHAVPCVDRDPVPLAEARVRRAAAWASRAGAWARPIVERARALPSTDRRWCHRDVQPQNLIVGERGVGLIDFEHTRPDDPLVDLVRLEARPWPTASRAAFVDGWRHPFTAAELDAHLALYGLATWVWARDHDDPGLAAVGAGALAQAGIQVPPGLTRRRARRRTGS